MKLTITHLKAPWPAGAVVGDVIELAAVPAWALGKCVPANDDSTVTASFPQGEAESDPAPKPTKAKAVK